MKRLIKEIDGKSVLIMCRENLAGLLESEGFEPASNETPTNSSDYTSMFTALDGRLVHFIGPVDCLAELVGDIDASTSPKGAQMAIIEAEAKAKAGKSAKAAKAREAKAAKAKAKEAGE